MTRVLREVSQVAVVVTEHTLLISWRVGKKEDMTTTTTTFFWSSSAKKRNMCLLTGVVGSLGVEICWRKHSHIFYVHVKKSIALSLSMSCRYNYYVWFYVSYSFRMFTQDDSLYVCTSGIKYDDDDVFWGG